MAAPIRKTKGNAQEMLQSHSQGLSALGRHKEQHETAAARSEKLASQRTGASPGIINLIEVRIGDVSCQRSLDLPRFVQQAPKFI
jgi:hypothetical protein